MKIKEKMLGSTLKHSESPERKKPTLHVKNKSEVVSDTNNFKKVYNSGNKFKGFAKHPKYSLPNALNWADLAKNKLKESVMSPEVLKQSQFNNEFKRRSSSLANLQNSKNELISSLKNSVPTGGLTGKPSQDTVLPMLYMPASLYKDNAKQITKKQNHSKSKNKNVTDKTSRNPKTL